MASLPYHIKRHSVLIHSTILSESTVLSSHHLLLTTVYLSLLYVCIYSLSHSSFFFVLFVCDESVIYSTVILWPKRWKNDTFFNRQANVAREYVKVLFCEEMTTTVAVTRVCWKGH